MKRTKKSIEQDKSIKALKAGKRISASGNVYHENRANRSDKDRRKKFAKGGSVDAPSIYVADLEAYNNGKLIGEWLDLSNFNDGSEVMDAINEMLEKWSKEQGETKEEYAIHDYENFPSNFYSEYMGERDFDKVIEFYKASEETGIPQDVIQGWLEQTGNDDASSIQDAYQGSAKSESDFAYDLIQDTGMPSNPEYYLYVSDTDRRLVAQEQADFYVDDIDDDRVLDEADMKSEADEYSEKESEIESLKEEMDDLDPDDDAEEIAKKQDELDTLEDELAKMDTYDEVVDKAREELKERIYDEWYEGLDDPYYFLVEQQGIYDSESILDASFVQFDYDKFADDLFINDYTSIKGKDGDVYVFSNYYKAGGEMKKYKKGGEVKVDNKMQDEIKKLRAVVNSPNIGEALKAKAQARIDMLEEKAGKSTPAPKPAPKAKKEKKAPVKKEKAEAPKKERKESAIDYAKRTRKAGESWQDAIKRASKELKNGGKPVAKKIKRTEKKAKPVAKKIKRTKAKSKPVAKKIKKTVKKAKTPKVPRTIKRVKYLNESSTKSIDKKVKALPPGKRISKSKKTYYEYRANRADLNAKKKL